MIVDSYRSITNFKEKCHCLHCLSAKLGMLKNNLQIGVGVLKATGCWLKCSLHVEFVWIYARMMKDGGNSTKWLKNKSGLWCCAKWTQVALPQLWMKVHHYHICAEAWWSLRVTYHLNIHVPFRQYTDIQCATHIYTSQIIHIFDGSNSRNFYACLSLYWMKLE